MKKVGELSWMFLLLLFSEMKSPIAYSDPHHANLTYMFAMLFKVCRKQIIQGLSDKTVPVRVGRIIETERLST
jgi:hypothetical protein